MKRVLSEVNWDLLFQPVESCSCDQSQFLHQNAFWTPPNLLKLSSSCLLNNFKNHHVFQSSPISSDNTYLQFQNFSKFFSFSNGVWCRGRIVWEIANFWRQIKKNEPLPQSTTSMESEMRCCLDRLKRYVQDCYQSGSDEAAVLFRRARKSRQVFWNLIIGLIMMLMLVKLYNFLLINKIKHFLEFLFILVAPRSHPNALLRCGL